MPMNPCGRIYRFFSQLNLFADGSTDPMIVEKQRFTTNIYLSSMSTLLLLIGLVTFTMERSITASVSLPTENTFQRLSSTHSTTLICPCHDISLLYQSFTRIEYRFHQVCSSELISDAWIQSISNDFDHMEMSFFWQVIAGFCRLSKTSIETVIDKFNVTALVSTMALEEELLRTETKAAFDDILSGSRSLFLRNLMAIQRASIGNQFVSALNTNFEARWSIENDVLKPKLFDRKFDNCSCLNLDGCPQPSMNGIISDCLMVSSVLQSSLQCYFNETCLYHLHPVAVSSISRLNPEDNHQFNITSTIADILNQFFLDELVIDVDFARYYQQCRPHVCSYSYLQRFDFNYSLTMIIGIFGALNTFLRLFSLYLCKLIYARRVVPTTVHGSIQESPPVRIRINGVSSALWQALRSFNLFRNRFSSQENLLYERWSTRLFLYLMITATIISGSYIFFSMQTQIVTISHPSLDTYHRLYHNYSSTLSCPCSQVSIPYKKFLMIDYTLHQICSSTLISPAWLQLTLAYNQSKSVESDGSFTDFRLSAPSYFQLLATVCSLVKNTFDNALKTLEESFYINQNLPSQSKFLEQMSSINQSLSTAVQQEFYNVQNWLHLMTTRSQLLIGLGTNGYLTENLDNNSIVISDRILGKSGQITETSALFTEVCSCRFYPEICQIVVVLDEVNAGQFYPRRNFLGMNTGCIPWLGLLATDPSWWYRTDIIDQIRLLFGDDQYDGSNPTIVPLNSHTETRFRYDDGSYPIFEDILKKGLLEQWTGQLTRFDLFYEQCAPKICNYHIRSKRSRLAALLLLISICGGLNQVLRWFSLVLIRLFLYARGRYYNRRDRGQWNIFGNMRQSWIEWNLFQSKSSDIVRIKHERKQTRIYVVLLLVSMMIIVLNTGLEGRTVVETLRPPANTTEYQQFRQMYPDTLECPCSRISLEYNTMIPKLNVESFHPICNSSFTDLTWFSYLFTEQILISTSSSQNYEQWIYPVFQLLATFCTLARDQVNQSLLTFLSSSITINRLISDEQFVQLLTLTISQLQQQIPTQFMQMTDLIRLSQQGNALISTYSSNWQYIVQNNNRDVGTLLGRQPVTYANNTCSCASSPRCSIPASMTGLTIDGDFIFDGLRIGCTVLESLLQSSFQCFYSAACIDSMTYNFVARRYDVAISYWNGSGVVSPIDNSSSTFADNDTMETIVNRMFINRWQHELSYEAFFQSCAPRQCTYTRHYRFDALQMITTFLTFFGGLSVCLRFLVPHLFTIAQKLRYRF